MRAGNLNETIVIYKKETLTDDYGAVKTEYVKVQAIKAYKRKLSASVGSGVQANEEFIANTIVFQIRKYPFINENIRISYNDNNWKVIQLDEQKYDNTYLMTLSKEK